MPPAKTQATLVIDQGTSSTKVFLFDSANHVVFKTSEKHFLKYPKPKHVEVDALSIAYTCKKLMGQAVNFSREKNIQISAAGVALQRSTFLFWDRKTLKPLTPALSWQDGRATDIVKQINNYSETIFKTTGAPLNSHFGGPKFSHLVNRSDTLRKKAKDGTAVFGSISSFLTQFITGNCLIDETIASRFTMMNLDTCRWEDGLLDLFGASPNCLPELVSPVYDFGVIDLNGLKIPLCLVIGDQQAALIGQGGFVPGSVAMNFGTSGSVQVNAGQNTAHVDGLISSVLFSDDSERHYLLEGTINACNSLFYQLEEELGIPHKDMQWHKRCENTETGGVFIPAASGIAAPYWTDHLKPVSEGFGDDFPNEIIRAGMESIGFLVHDIWTLAKTYLDTLPEKVMVSGGGGRPPLLQFISDLTGLNVNHSIMKDRTAFGVHALLTKSQTGNWPYIKVETDDGYTPIMDQKIKMEKLERWKLALIKAGVI
ncbi:MAG: FGGY family carbohydrate kinase [Candidatus Marinimicrobia bacterium]|nr:FGGY family carbohydrate kinase [Candidatus Neomarinimicrobiota bacterium]